MIYTTDTIALTPGTKIVVGVDGAEELLPKDGLLRLGGDGHAAKIVKSREIAIPQVQNMGISFRVILSAPGIFEEGWLPPGVEKAEGRYLLRAKDFTAQLLALTAKRHEVISGWDLAQGKPKTAHRVVPAGSVYWFEQVEGTKEGRDAWCKEVLQRGWWPSKERFSVEQRRRQSEGFNNVFLGSWARAAS